MSLVESIIRYSPQRVSSEMSIRDVAKGMFTDRIRVLLVKENENDVGIVTYTSLANLSITKRIDPETTAIKEIMTSPILTIDHDKSIVEAGELMLDKGVRHLAVTKDKKIVGLLDITEVLAHQLNIKG